MKKSNLIALLLSLNAWLGLPGLAQESPDRTSLPIQEPPRPTYKELDVRGLKAPPRFEVKAPKGAPNESALVTDITLRASEAFKQAGILRPAA